MFKKLRPFFLGIAFLFLPFFALALEQSNFFIDSSYDFQKRNELKADLIVTGKKLYFYTDDAWWQKLNSQEKLDIETVFYSLSAEFDSKIYPILTSSFGTEWIPGIDRYDRIYVLIHPMIKDARGYFRKNDEYLRAQSPFSNEKEMIYLNADYVTSSLEKSFLAHEFTHLIIFNQKTKKYGVEEETWLEEARAEYAPTLVGYDQDYSGSYLEGRAKVFLENQSDSLTEWKNAPADYGVVNIFTQYLVEKYGIKILTDSLNSKEIGIKSLNEALIKNNFKEDFSKIFADWTITVFANDCSLGEGNRYCYQNENLKNLLVNPSINFLPLSGNSVLAVTQSTKNWTGNWLKFIGGKDSLQIDFTGSSGSLFKVPYLLKDLFGKYSLYFFQLDKNQKGKILISGLMKNVGSVIIIPSLQSKVFGFSDNETPKSFSWQVSSVVEVVEPQEEEQNLKYLEKPLSKMTKDEIIAKISEINSLLNLLQNQLLKIENKKQTEELSCQRIDQDLFYGLKNNNNVRCLQGILISQGEGIYPEGLITGNFLSFTKSAVIRFQERYAAEILTPLGLTQGTGYVGYSTRAKLNQFFNL